MLCHNFLIGKGTSVRTRVRTWYLFQSESCDIDIISTYTYVHVYVRTCIQHCLKNDLKYKHSGATVHWQPCPAKTATRGTRTTTETVLREAMQALVRLQAHMLSRIVVEIRAADITVGLEP
jgi:hypothetical protein